MSYSISKEFHFSAAHHLTGLPPEHQCSRVHGHNYVVVVDLYAGTLDGPGFVLDYGELAPFGRLLDERYDHRDLNRVLGTNPTAENLARELAYALCEVVRMPAHIEAVEVSVSETPKTWASFRMGPPR